HFLNRSFTPERASTAVAQRSAAEIDHVGFAALSFDQISVTGALQVNVGPMPGAEDVGVGMKFVWPGEVSWGGHGYRGAPSGAAFRREQIIPAVAFVEMGRFGEAERSPFENELSLADELAFLD